MPRYDPTRDRTKPEPSSEDRPTMGDVSHTPPDETTANGVWGRGPAPVDAPTPDQAEDARTADQPADD